MKSKTVCFFRPSPILTNFTGLHKSEWLLQASHTIDNNTQIWKFACTTKKASCLHAFTGCETYSSPVLAKNKSV